MRRTIIDFLFATLVFCVIFLCNSCRGDSSKHAIQGDERIDTCNCSTLVSMKPYEHNSWLFATKRDLIIMNPLKPKVIIELIKGDKYTDRAKSETTLSLKIDSAICVDEGGYIFFVFTDNTKFALKNLFGNNCNGNMSASFEQDFNDIEEVKNVVDIKKVCEVKIRYIRVMTHDGYRDFNLSDIEASNLQRLFNCIYEAK